MKFNITKNLNAYGGRNKWSVPIGTTRNIRGSANRIYNYCDRTTNDPLYCMFRFTPPKPIPIPIKGFFSFSFDFTLTRTRSLSFLPSPDLILAVLPIVTLPGVFEINEPKITITLNSVYVEIETNFYEQPSYPTNLGITFDKTYVPSNLPTPPIPLTDFYNNIQNLTLISATNCPFSKDGNQFAGITHAFNIQSSFKPYFLPGTSLAGCFLGCTFFNSDISFFNTSNVTNMASMFQNATAFNQNIGNWDVSNVTSMAGMFQNATAFNQNIGNWDVSNVTSMAGMFQQATAFNQNIGNWNVSNVLNMNSMFQGDIFNNGGSSSISTWTAPLCSDFQDMFYENSSFNQPLTNLLKTSNVSTTTQGMFLRSPLFNQDIGGWDVSKVTSMSNMFESTPFNNGGSSSISTWTAPLCSNFYFMFAFNSSFNQPLPNLVQTSYVSTTMQSMFQQATAFNQDIGTWDMSNVTLTTNMFKQATAFNNGGSSTISSWSAPLCSNFEYMFYLASNFNQPLTNLLKISGVSTTTQGMFQQATAFNQDIGGWDVSNVTNMGAMFSLATAFNNGGSSTISSWSAPLCTRFNTMFSTATSFNQPLPILVDTTNVSSCNMGGMFTLATAFNQNIGTWKVSNVTDMNAMFQSATAFNNNGSSTISSWSAPLCTDFSLMFYLNTAFNQPLTNLVNTSGVTGCTMNLMFRQASLFNQDIGNWNVSKVTDMNAMFLSASAFNNGEILSNLSSKPLNWSAPLCTSFTNMFNSAAKFNQSLNNLVDTSTSGVTSCTMNGMFRYASLFNQNIGAWNVSKVTIMNVMFQNAIAFNNGSTSSISNWNAPLCATFNNMFNTATSFNQPLTNLVNTSGVTSCSMNAMFLLCPLFDQDIGGWNVSKVTTMTQMFQQTNAFNNGGSSTITNWTAPLCTNFSNMFRLSTFFNQPIPNLVNTSGVTSCSMFQMFQSATAFNQNIGTWNVSKVTSMGAMFEQANAFNNGGSSTISSWSAPLCTNFEFMFYFNSAFNQPLTNLVNTSGVTSCTMLAMFQSATAFNQDIGTWNVSKVTTMNAMFQQATSFNNGGSSTISSWTAPLCTDFTNMFYLDTSFNQPLTNLVNTSGVTSCTMFQMFLNATAFNNGETGLQNIPNVNPLNASYTNASKILTCPDATFSSTLVVNDVLIIQTSTIVYSSAIQNIASDTSLTLTTAFGSNILTGIISIQKQIPGSNPLNWNTSNVTTFLNMFQNAIFFNQTITTNGNIWNTYKVTNLTNMFLGSSSSLINLFNNGQIITGQTAPMGWTFNATPTSTNYRTNCRLTASNKPASLA